MLPCELRGNDKYNCTILVVNKVSKNSKAVAKWQVDFHHLKNFLFGRFIGDVEEWAERVDNRIDPKSYGKLLARKTDGKIEFFGEKTFEKLLKLIINKGVLND